MTRVSSLTKPVFPVYYREYIRYLKCNSGRLSVTFCFLDVSCKCPAITSQHTGTELALALHGENILVKSLSMLIAHFIGRSLSKSLRNSPLKIHYTPRRCGIVPDQPPYHDSFLLYMSQYISTDIFK